MQPKTVHRVLVADDNVDERFLTKRALDRVLSPGSIVRTVRSGNDAIAYMVGEGKYSDRKIYPFPTLIITDLNMEDGDGFDVLEFLNSNQGWSVVPRIVLSSSDDEDDVRTAFFLGASAYHLKLVTGRFDEQLRAILEYWATSQVPAVDQGGRLIKTSSAGRLGERYHKPEAGDVMVRLPSRTPPHRSPYGSEESVETNPAVHVASTADAMTRHAD